MPTCEDGPISFISDPQTWLQPQVSLHLEKRSQSQSQSFPYAKTRSWSHFMPMVFACLRSADTGNLISSSVGLSPQFLNTGSEYYSFKMLKSPPDTRALFWKYPFPICTLLFWYLLDLHVALLIGCQVFTWSNVASCRLIWREYVLSLCLIDLKALLRWQNGEFKCI